MTQRNFLGWLLSLLCSTSFGCSHLDDSPKVTVNAVLPDLVCNAQLTTPVLISGKGFTPETTRALKNKPDLVLPEVRLTQSQTLLGEAEKADPFILSGTRNKDNWKALTWQSSEQLTVDVSESLKLKPGIYDLTVTNPDGEKKAELAKALAVVPPPKLTELLPESLCDAQSDQTLVLVGTTFLSVDGEQPTVTITAESGEFSKDFKVTTIDDCETIPGRAEDVEMCTHATIVIPAKTLAAGQYSVVLKNPSPAACATTESVTLTINPPPTVLSVAPSTICSSGSDLQVIGHDFQSGASVELHCGDDTPITAVDVTFIDSEHLEATFGPGMAPGDNCDVVVVNPDTCTDEPLPHQTVTGTEGPIAFYADPSVSYTGIATRITVYLTAVTGTFTAALIAADGTETVLTDAALVPGKNNRVQATVPAGLAAGNYTITVRDETQCRATLEKGLVLTNQATINISTVDPPFAQTGLSTAVTITGNSAGFAPTPRLFLMADTPQTGDIAIQLGGVTVVDGNTLTAVIPPNASVNVYDLVVVDATGSAVGILDKAVTITANPPPVVNNVVPQSIVAATGQTIEVQGNGFTGSTVSLRCVNAAGQPISAPQATSTAPVCSTGTCTQAATIDGSAISAGSVCVVRVTNTDKSYGEFSAIGVTNSSYNLNNPKAGPSLQQGRRALAAAAVKATRASRFVYAIGGDTGDGTLARKDVEVAAVDIFGNMKPWATARTSLGTARSLAGNAVLGRYVYVFGGSSDGSLALTSGERALVLSPEEVPEITDVDLCLAGGTVNCFAKAGLSSGVGEGAVSYRVSAVIDPADPQNLGGETLASENLVLRLPTVASRNVIVKLMWKPPVDSKGVTLTGITGYRVYRTALNGIPGRDEVLLGLVANTVLEYIDDGSVALQTDVPLKAGSTSAWQVLPNLNTARAGLSSAVAPEPGNSNLWHLYALAGKDNAAITGGNVLATYEHLAITVLANGRQTVSNSWAPGANNVGAARWLAGAWVVDHDTASLVTSGNTWLYLGGGALANGNGVSDVGATLVGASGVLGTFSAVPEDFSSSRIGYGTVAAAGRLFAFGGRAPNPKSNATAALIIDPAPTLAANAWNNEGLNLSTERYLPGTAVQSAFIFLIGGESSATKAQTTTDFIVW
jgi:hypothetical protein